MKINEKIIQLRKINKVSQKALADYIGVKVPCVSLWESGKREISTENVLKIAKFFKVPATYLFDDKYESLEQYTEEIGQIKTAIENLNEDETQHLLNYIDFLISQRK